MASPNCAAYAMSFRVTCYIFIILPLNYCCVFIFSLSSLYQLEQLAHLQQSLVPLQHPLADVVIATDATPHSLGLLFSGIWVTFIS